MIAVDRLLLHASGGHGGLVAPCCKFDSVGAGAESSLSRLQFARSRLAPGAPGSLDPAADPDLGPSAEMSARGDEHVAR